MLMSMFFKAWNKNYCYQTCKWPCYKSTIYNSPYNLGTLAYIQRRQWQPTPVLLPGKFHGWRSLVGCSPWGREKSDKTEQLHFHALEKAMATHSSVLAWRIPRTAEPGGLLSMGSHRVGHDWSGLAAAAAAVLSTILSKVICGFPGGSDGKESTSSAGDMGSIPGLGRSPGGGHGNPLQYSCLENLHGQRSLAGYSP